MGLLRWFLERKREYEPEHIEPVEHDIVIVNGQAICGKEAESDDSEEGQQL